MKKKNRQNKTNKKDNLPKQYITTYSSSPTTQLDQRAKSRQKIFQKNREIDGSYLFLQQFDKF